MRIYEKCKKERIPIRHHESNLYIPVNEITKKLLNDYGYHKEIFKIDNELWFDVACQYDPFFGNLSKS